MIARIPKRGGVRRGATFSLMQRVRLDELRNVHLRPIDYRTGWVYLISLYKYMGGKRSRNMSTVVMAIRKCKMLSDKIKVRRVMPGP